MEDGWTTYWVIEKRPAEIFEGSYTNFMSSMTVMPGDLTVAMTPFGSSASRMLRQS